MKKVISVMALVFCALSINAQILRTEELEDYAKEKYGEKWVDAAENLGSQLKLDKNNALTFTQVIESPGKTKDQLYVLLNYWFSATFNDANSVIQLNVRVPDFHAVYDFDFASVHFPLLAGETVNDNGFFTNFRCL